MKKLILTLILGLVPFTSHASVELFQIVAFGWDQAREKLSVVSLGSGTAIEKNLVLTNKHVVEVDDKVADFILLCQADSKRTRGVKCKIPAGVVAVHPDFDAALIKPLSSQHYFPAVRVISGESSIGTQVRLAGFPVPLEEQGLQGFGGTKTVDAFKSWVEGTGGAFEFEGDELTITRGQVLNKGELPTTGGRYLVTNAKVNFGNSGGAAFDQNGSYVGIPTLKDQNSNAYILSYYQIRDWVEASKSKPAHVLKEASDFYDVFSGQKVTSKPSRTRYSKSKRTITRRGTMTPSYSSARRSSIAERLRLRRQGGSVTTPKATVSTRRTYSRRYSSSARSNQYSSYKSRLQRYKDSR